MNCHDIQQAMIDALYGELSASTHRNAETHRATCAECAEVWASLHAMQRALGQWREVAPPADLRERVLASVTAQSGAVAARAWWRRGLASTGLSVMAGLAMMVITVMLLSRSLVL